MKLKGLMTMVMCCSLGALAAQRALAQHAPPPGLDVPAPLAAGTTKAGAPVPDWLVWRVFHDSMRFYGKQSPEAVERVLTQKAALTPDQADAVLRAGSAYLQAMTSIDDAAQAEIQQRYRSADLPSSTRNIPRPAFRKGAVPPSGPPVEWGGNLREQVQEDGLVARVNRQKTDALAAHRRALSASLGPDALTALESWLETNVAPGVKVFDKATRAATPTPGSQGR